MFAISFRSVASGFRREIESRDELGQATDRLRIHTEDLAHFTHGHFGPVGDDVCGHCRAGMAVFRKNVLDDLLALLPRRKINVDVGPLASFFGQETFEEELHSYGVYGGDSKCITDGAIGSGSTSLAQDSLVACVAGNVLDDQEIACQIEFLDDAEFMRELFWNAWVGVLAIAFSRTDSNELA